MEYTLHHSSSSISNSAIPDSSLDRRTSFLCSAITVIIITLAYIMFVGEVRCVEDSVASKQIEESSELEVTALIVSCHKEDTKEHSGSHTHEGHDIVRNGIYVKPDFIKDPLVTDCTTKLYITLKFNAVEKSSCKDVFIVDHVTDYITHRRVRLLNPYVFKVKYDHALQLYGLKFIHLVNGEAREHVLNKDTKHFLGCDDSYSSVNPTCGFAYEDGSAIPYSQGFCCSCNSHLKNKINIQNNPDFEEEFKTSGKEARFEDSGNTLVDGGNHFTDVRKMENPDSQEYRYDSKKPPHRDGIKARMKNKNLHRETIDDIYDQSFDTENKSYKRQVLQNKEELCLENDSKIKPLTKEQSNGAIHNTYLDNPTKETDTVERRDMQQRLENSIEPFRVDIPIPRLHGDSMKTDRRTWDSVSSLTNGNPVETSKNFEEVQNVLPIGSKPKRSSLIDNSEYYTNSDLGEEYRLQRVKVNKQHKNLNERITDLERLRISETREVMYLRGENETNHNLDSLQEEIIRKRGLDVKRVQRRGGQNCENRTTPPTADPETYHKSAHCLRFGDLWYSVYRLEKPILLNDVYFKLFEVHDCKERKHWCDFTQGDVIQVSPFFSEAGDEKPTYAFHFSPSDDIFADSFALDYQTMRLLIPEPVGDEKKAMYPEIMGGPREYLVLTDDQISFSGADCDKAGVGYEAFTKQPDRCAKRRGTCLKNQPVDLWRKDIEARLSGRKGHYFLENYGHVPEDPIKRNGSQEFISLEYSGKFSFVVNIEINADTNALVDLGTLGRITEVFVDASSSLRTYFYVTITNTGLASARFSVKMTDCSPDSPAEWTDQRPVFKKIPPQQDKKFVLSLDGEMSSSNALCTVELINEREELLARRQISINRRARCFCIWHCLCACIDGVDGLKCRPISTEQYNDAGFQGGVPLMSGEGSYLMSVLFIFVLLFLLLLFLGALKGIVGLCCCPMIGMWGLDLLVEHPRQIPHYYEEELHGRTVIYDCGGFPVHPDTKLRSVRTISKTTEFCLNCVFFLVFPCAICFKLCRRSVRGNTKEGSIDWTNTIVIKDNDRGGGKSCGCPGGDYDHIENDDRKFVMDQFHKSYGSPDDNEPLLPHNENGRVNDRGYNGRNSPEDYQDQQNYVTNNSPKRSSVQSPSTTNQTVAPLLTNDTYFLLPGPYNNTYGSLQPPTDNENVSDLVERLLEAEDVFRNFQHPLGGAEIPHGKPYCIRGILKRKDGGFFFCTEMPLIQYWQYVDEDVDLLDVPKEIDYQHFTKYYQTPGEVYLDTSITDYPKGICLNIVPDSM